MDKSDNKSLLLVLLFLILIGLSANLAWRYYKQSIIKIGCVLADEYCSIAGGGYFCDFYKKKKYETFCLPPVDLNEWLAYRNANRDIYDARLMYSDVKEMMRQGKFAKLERYYIDMQMRYENRDINEFTYNWVMDSLRLKDKEVVALYDEWLRRIPNSYIARFGRGATHYLIGWNKRGTKWARDTSRESMSGYRMHHLQAAGDLRAAIALHPKMTIAYRDLVSIDNLGASGRDYWLAESFKYDPYNYLVRRAYIWKLQPRWGGSHHAMHEFASSALQYLDKNPLLRGLAAVEFSDKASTHRSHKRYDKAIEDGLIAIYHRPDADSYQYHAYSYQESKRYKEAIRYAEEGLRQEPDHIQLLHRYAWSSRDDHQYEKADDGFGRLIKLRPKNAYYWYARGSMHYTLRKFGTAMRLLEKSHELEPYNNQYLYWFALSAINNRVPIALVKMRSFLERCKTGECIQKDVDWARRWIDCVDGKPKCGMPEHEISIWQKSPLYSS